MNLGLWPVQASAVVLGTLGLLAFARRGSFLVTALFGASFLALAGVQALQAGALSDPAAFVGSARAGRLLWLSLLVGELWLALLLTLGRAGSARRLARHLPWILLWAAAGAGILRWQGTAGVLAAAAREGRSEGFLLGPAGPWFLCWALVTLVFIVANCEATLRLASGAALRRLRLMLLAFMGAMGYAILVIGQALLYRFVPLSHIALGGWIMLAAGLVSAYSLVRHRMSDLDVPAARPVVYSAVTTTVIGGYLLIAAAAAEVSDRLDLSRPALGLPVVFGLAVAGATMLVFSPRLTRRVRGFVDRNLYAQRYDYRREWSRASRHLRPSDPMPELAASISELLRSVLGCAEARVLVRALAREELESIDGAGGWRQPLAVPLAHPLVRLLRDRPRPALLQGETANLDSIPLLVEGAFLWGEFRPAVAAAMIADTELVGVLLLGPKARGEGYNSEDLDLLETLSAQLANVLWARRLSDELVQARELESFNRVASFVLHDLKNCVSGLSLTLQNAERAEDDPAFREAALRSMAGIVQRMQGLIARIARVRVAEEIERAPCNVADLVQESLGRVMGKERPAQLRLVQQTEGLDRACVDRVQMVSVFENLIHNACEAMPEGGELAIRAFARSCDAREGAAGAGAERELVVAVRDTGSGIPPALLRGRLFQPFASTKRRGLGLGLYQSRAIVEAHGGRIEVESVEGQGSEFRVVLPLVAGRDEP